MSKLKHRPPLPLELSTLLDHFENAERPKIEALFRRALSSVARELNISSLWEQPELAVTYWILLLSGVNQEDEMEIAQTLLTWKAFIAKDSALVLCIPHSERTQFRQCSASFRAVKTPTLILSDSRDMYNHIKIDPELLFTLSGKRGGLQRFMTEIHSSIENGNSLGDIENQLLTERFWSGMKLVYAEVKGFVSFKIG